jgi:hypothetical protein
MITYAVTTSNVVIGATATLIVAYNKDRSHLEISGAGNGSPVLIGGSSMTSEGYPINPTLGGATIPNVGPFVLTGVSATAAIYGIYPGGGGSVNVLEISA